MTCQKDEEEEIKFTPFNGFNFIIITCKYCIITTILYFGKIPQPIAFQRWWTIFLISKPFFYCLGILRVLVQDFRRTASWRRLCYKISFCLSCHLVVTHTHPFSLLLLNATSSSGLSTCTIFVPDKMGQGWRKDIHIQGRRKSQPHLMSHNRYETLLSDDVPQIECYEKKSLEENLKRDNTDAKCKITADLLNHFLHGIGVGMCVMSSFTFIVTDTTLSIGVQQMILYA